MSKQTRIVNAAVASASAASAASTFDIEYYYRPFLVFVGGMIPASPQDNQFLNSLVVNEFDIYRLFSGVNSSFSASDDFASDFASEFSTGK